MDIENKTDTIDAIKLIMLRNHFYRKKYYLLLGIYILSIIVIGLLIGMLVYVLHHPPIPRYFIADKVGRLIQEIPVQAPNMSTDDVAAWATDAVQAAYSYDYVNYRSQLQDAQKYFTDYGWRTYMSSLKASNNLIALTERKLIIIAKAAAPPKLLIEGILGGAYAWKFEIPLLVTYLSQPYDDKSKFQNALVVTVVVQRQKSLESYKGLGIVQMIGNLVLNPTSQTLTEPGPGG